MQSSQEKRKKNAFCATVRKKCEKTVFFFHVFWDTLFKVRKKKRFFLARRFAKTVSVLSRFSRQFVQSSQKIRKMSVFWVFSRTFPKKCEKTVFFTFFETICTKFAENFEKQRFLNFLRDVPPKEWENSVFSCFSRHFVQSSHKIRKNSVFWAFCATFRKKCEKTVFFSRFSRHFVLSSRKKFKNSVFFARRYAKSVRKQCSFTFFETLCTKFAENEKNQRFLRDVMQKVWENSIFSRCLRHFVQIRIKCWKTVFFSLFPKTFRKKC